MITIRNFAEPLPKTLPDEVRRACQIAIHTETAAHENTEWQSMTSILLRLVRTPPSSEIAVGITSLDWGPRPVADTVSLLRELDPSTLTGRRGIHVGFIAASETWRTRADVDNELAELLEGRPPTEVRQGRVAVGVLSSGWIFVVTRRQGSQPVLRVARAFQADQHRDFQSELVHALDDLNSKFLREDAARA